MPIKRSTLLITLIVLVTVIYQVWLISRVSDWGLNGPYPFTILRSFQLPVLMALIGIYGIFAFKPPDQRRPMYWFAAIGGLEVAIVASMRWYNPPSLVLVILGLNAVLFYHAAIWRGCLEKAELTYHVCAPDH
jgi:hypothetical protein